MKKISEHVSYKEGVYSNTATRLGLENKPTEEHLNNMTLLSVKVFEPLREWVGGPIRINSFYRGPELNKAIGGSERSQHCKGEAVDIECPGTSNYTVAKFIEDNIDYDQLILEFYTPGIPDSGWVHVSYVGEGNRKQSLTAMKENGKTVYKPGLIE